MRSKLKVERRKQATKLFLFLLIAVLAGTISWWTYRAVSDFLFRSEHFVIRSVDVRGVTNLSHSEITMLLPFRNGDNMFSFDAGEVEAEIAKLKPELKDISVSRSWKKIVVSVRERKPVAFVSIDGQRMGLDLDNRPFPLRGAWAKEDIPEIISRGEQERSIVLDFIRLFAPKAGQYFAGVLKLRVEPVDRLILEMKDGSRVFWGPYEAPKVGAKLKRLLQVLQEAETRYETLEYINLNFFDDGRIVIKPKTAARRPLKLK